MRSVRALSSRTRFVVAAALASLPLLALVAYAAADRYDSDRTRAETRASTRAQIYATLLAKDYHGIPTQKELEEAVRLLPVVTSSAAILYDGRREVTRFGDPKATPGDRAEVGDALRRRGGTFHAKGADGTVRVWGLSPVRGTPLTVAFGLPGSSVYGASRDALHRELLLAALAAGLALLAAFFLADRVVGPLSRRSAQLQVDNAALQAANEAKNEFLGRMSHELRTPLAAIMGFNELLALSDLDEERRRWTQMSLKASRHLLDLVNEVLDLARIESGQLGVSPETVALRPLMVEAIELMRPLAATRAVTIEPPVVAPGCGYVFADNQRLKQVLINLLSNAVKFNRDGGTVRISAQPAGEDRISISVQDTGPGLDGAAIAKLFVPFERLDATSRGVEGTGLGLAVSRSLAEAMEGRLDVRSTPDVGSTFTLELRRGEPAAAGAVVDDAHPRLAVRPHGAERSVLYIEDTLANMKLVEEILTRRPSVTVIPAMLGRLGIELAQDHLPDLILLDLHLPDMEGADVLDELQADERTRGIPVVVLTADATERHLDRLIAAGARSYVSKPIGVVQLLELVDEYLGAEERPPVSTN